MRRLTKYLYYIKPPQGSYAYETYTLAMGTIGAQLINVCMYPILTRIYQPDQFGLFALYMSITTIIAMFSTCGYEVAIVLPEKEREAKNLTFIVIILVSTVCAVSFIIFNTFKIEICRLLGNPGISAWLTLIPVSVFLVALFQTFNYWAIRKRLYKEISLSNIFQSGITASTQIKLNELGGGGLIGGSILGQFISTALLGIRSRLTLNSHQSINELWETAKYHIDFPKFYLPTVMLDTLSKNLPIIFISSLFSNNLVGLYSFALRILSLPLLLIGTSVGQVFYQKFSENTHNIQSRKALLTKTWRHLALIGLVPMIICFMYSAPIFAFVFGEEWRLAGEIAAILSPYLYAQFVFSPTSTVFIALKQQNINLIFGFFVMTYRILVLWFGHHINNFMAALQILVIVEIIEIFIYDYILWKKL